MKKAKIFLSTFAVLALVASALAFNANKFTKKVYCGTVQGAIAGSSDCPAFTPSTFSSGTGSFCTITLNTECLPSQPPVHN